MTDAKAPVWIRRALRIMGGTLGRVVIFLVFLLSLAVGAVIHLDLKVSRRVAAQLVVGPLSDSLRGTIQVRSFTRLARNGISVDEVVVLDPEGRTTLQVREVSVEVDVFSILERVFSDNPKLSIEVERVTLTDCDVNLLPTTARDEKGQLLLHPSIADAFEPIKTGKSSTKNSRPVRLWFPHIRLENVHARGSVAGSPTLDAKVQRASGSVLATDKGASIDVKRFQLKVSGVGGVDTRAHGEVHIRAPGAVWGDVQGVFGQVPLSQTFRYENGNIDIKGELPSLKPEALRPLLGSWPLDKEISIKNHIKGKAPTLTASATIASKDAPKNPTEVLGVLHLAPRLTLDVKAVTRALNLKSLLSTLPESSLDSEIRVRVRSEEEGVTAVFDGRINEGIVADEPTPAAKITGKVNADGLVADGHFAEPGFSTKIHVTHSEESGTEVSAQIDELDLRENERAKKYALGSSGKASGTIHLSLSGESIETRADITVANFRRDNISTRRARIEGKTQGNIRQPLKSQGKLSLTVEGSRVGPLELRSGTALVTGPLLSPQVQISAETSQGLTLKIGAQTQLESGEFRDISASITGREEPIEATVKHISAAGSKVTVKALVIRSIGEIRADLDFGGNTGKIDLEAENLSFSRLASNLGLPKNEYGGDLNANVHLLIGPHSEGTIDFELSNGALFGVNGVNVDAHATIEGKATRGNVNGSIAGLGEVESSWEGELGGPLHLGSSYQQATGRIHAEVRNLDLKGLSLLLGKTLGIPEVSGALTARLDAERASRAGFPAAELSFETTQLAVTLGENSPDNDSSQKSSSRKAPLSASLKNDGKKTIRIEGIDVEGGLSLRPLDDLLEGVVRLNDRYGTLLSLSSSIELPLQSWGKDLPDWPTMKESLETGTLSAVLVAPRRRLDRFPTFLEIPLEMGTATLRASASGTLRAPELTLLISGNRLEGPASPFSRPVDVSFNSSYLPVSGDLRGSFSLLSRGDQVASGQLDVLLPLSRFGATLGSEQPIWTGTGTLQLDNADLSLLRELKERKMLGSAQGLVSFERHGWEPHVESELRLRDLEFGGNPLGDALLETQTFQSDLVARAQFTDDYGVLQIQAEAGVVPSPWLLEFTERKPIYLTLQAERFDAAIAHPFATEILDELSGSLTGKLKAELTPPSEKGGEFTASISGNMTMKDGIVTPTALGVRLEDTELTLKATQEGAMNVLRVKDISARAASSRHNLKGEAVLYFKNLTLHGGTFHVSPEDVPLRSNDVELARLTGAAEGRFDMTGETARVEVRINNLEANLPKASDSDLFVLDENPTIQILQRPNPEKTATEESESSVTEIKFILGNSVRLKSEFLDLKLRGDPQMRLAEDLQMRGALSLIPGGRILVLGRRFIVEEGTVLFDTADAADPHLSVAAAWSAPNGVRVRVTVGGTARAPQLSWSSEPALPGGEAEVIALVLGGGGGSTDQGQASITSGLAFAANEALGQTGTDRVQFYTTQETSGTEGRVASLNDSSWESYTATYRISDELWFEGSYEQAQGTGPQTTARSTGVSGTLDWRFHPHWSLRSEVGTLGAGLDLVWRYRY